jgi:hypothetical protein
VLTKGTVTTVTTVASAREAPVGLSRALVVLLVAIIVCTFKLRQKKATTIVKAIPTTTINNPVAQASATSGVEMKDAI